VQHFLIARCSRQLTVSAQWIVVTLGVWNPYAVLSLEAVALVESFWWDWSLSRWPNGFLQCFDAVGWVI